VDYDFGNPRFVSDIVDEVARLHGSNNAGWVAKGFLALIQSNSLQRVNKLNPDDVTRQFVTVRYTVNLKVRGVQLLREDDRVESGQTLVTQFLDRFPSDISDLVMDTR